MPTQIPNSRVMPRFAGLVTFGRYPRVADVSPADRPLDWVFYGVPFDGGVTYRPGARFGPRAIREESQYLKPYSMAHRVNVCEQLSLADAGDAPVSPYSAPETARSVAEYATDLPDPATARLLALGGDHSVAYANIRATWERRGRPPDGLALIHFDSHLDTVDSVWGEKWGHASVFIRAIEDGLVDPGRMISIGVKGPLNSAADTDFARRHGVTMVTRDELENSGPATIRAFVDGLGGAPAYVTFDVDVVDPAFAPGTGTPSVGGISSADALTLVRSLRGLNVAGADVVEVLPDRDHAGITALLAAHVAFEIVCLSCP
ncbi:MAG: agmatinase [Phycisphaeraceae bacterium]|nr:agmatinase [Phycisphaerae bacterium]MBX3392006.1 agmatinase [Phycisphaeraceae bacterium]